MPADNIWDLAIEKARTTEKDESFQPKDSNIIFLGNKQSGKTSIIYRFVDRQEIPKPTLALEYLFGRRSRGLDTAKEVCHIWELGGGLLFTNLLEISITTENLLSLSVAIVLDLSVPEELWFTMETLLQACTDRIKDVLNLHAAKSKELKQILIDKAWKRVGENHEDKDKINPFPLPLVIFGSKYDIFQNMDPEKKKVISRCLRFVAHSNGAMLCFVSTKSENIITKSRALISSLVFGTSASKTVISDYNKPIYIPFGGDSFKSIGNLTSSDDSGKHFSRSIDMWKHIFLSHFPQVTSKLTVSEDPGKDPHFKERDIDIMRAQKDKELEEYRRELQKKRKEYDNLDY
ncbi:cytoplasmic dynein 2 light intermediate chain 1 [Centruroides vittatus]|uniref:cytoplasmic dynein 2 light intermediate chain 1 n=1 Tax=Centruroides vittatus TaxID=120091 RepID=UPI00350F4188